MLMRLDSPPEQTITRPLSREALVRRVDLASQARNACVRGWLDQEMPWLAPPDRKPGRSAAYLASANLDWAVPDYNSLCRGQKTPAAGIPYLTASGQMTLAEQSQAPGKTNKRVVTRSCVVGRHPFQRRNATERTEDTPFLSDNQASAR